VVYVTARSVLPVTLCLDRGRLLFADVRPFTATTYWLLITVSPRRLEAASVEELPEGAPPGPRGGSSIAWRGSRGPEITAHDRLTASFCDCLWHPDALWKKVNRLALRGVEGKRGSWVSTDSLPRNGGCGAFLGKVVSKTRLKCAIAISPVVQTKNRGSRTFGEQTTYRRVIGAVST
jgi:hypothetical protein